MPEKENMVTITIDGRKVTAEAGRNLLKVARENGFDIPGVCYHPKLSPTASCRLCVVKIDGSEWPTPACTTYVEEGMEVVAFDEELKEHRINLVDLMLSEHNCTCITCDAAGDCAVQDLGQRYGLIKLNSEKFRDIYNDVISKYQSFPTGRKKTEEMDAHELESNEYTGEPQDCIRCGYCIDVCPVNIYPVLIMEAAEMYSQPGKLENLYPEDCIGCGLCSFVCPGQIRIPYYFPEKSETHKKKAE